MASDYDFLSVSNGNGDAALMHVNGSGRIIGANVIPVDSVTNVPAKFIAIYGVLGSNGLITPASGRNFKGHVSGMTLVIDGFEPGSTDNGNNSGDVVLIKPNSGWSNRVAQFIKNSTGFGTPENATFAALTATSAVIGGKDISQLTPTGAIMPFAGSVAPVGWLVCDGTAVSRTTYAALFTAIDTAYGAGDGSTTFNIPNAKGRNLSGLDATQAEFVSRGTNGGQKTVQAHAHGVNDPGHGHGMSDPGHSHDNLAGIHAGGGGGDWSVTTASANRSTSLNWSDGTRNGGSGTGVSVNGAGTGVSIQNAGAGSNNLNPYLVVNYLVKT